MRYCQNKFLYCRWCHQWRWSSLVLRLQHFIAYNLLTNCANDKVSRFISLWDMVKTYFCNVGSGGGATWCPGYSISFPIICGVTVSNIRSLALFLYCRWCHQWRWSRLVLRLQHFIAYNLLTNCAKDKVSRFISLWDMVKTYFCNVGSGVGATWCPFPIV